MYTLIYIINLLHIRVGRTASSYPTNSPCTSCTSFRALSERLHRSVNGPVHESHHWIRDPLQPSLRLVQGCHHRLNFRVGQFLQVRTGVRETVEPARSGIPLVLGLPNPPRCVHPPVGGPRPSGSWCRLPAGASYIA